MTGYITGDGHLHLLRGTRYTPQICIYDVNSEKMCGDGCPHFREPRFVNNIVNLQICNGRTITFKDFKDERI